MHIWLKKMGLALGPGSMLLGTAGARDKIIFSTAPTQTPEKTITLYTPLLNYLSQVTGKQFVIKPAKNYLEYNNGTLQNAYDMVFDGPHYTGWRMERQGAVPVARLPGSITSVAALPAQTLASRHWRIYAGMDSQRWRAGRLPRSLRGAAWPR